MKYFIKSKHLCDVFAEKDAFTVMMRLTDKQFAKVYEQLGRRTRKTIDEKYPCGEGGRIHFRVLSDGDLNDAKSLISAK